VHKEELDISGIIDEESLVAGGHHVAGFLVGAKSDLNNFDQSMLPVLLK
jgi:hypothetical protein